MKKKFNTKVIHSGHGSDKETGAVMPPIHLSSTFKQIEPGNFEYEYARTKNPSRDVLEKLLAQIESGDKAFAFASGMSAINTVCDLFGTNYHIVCSDDVYGGTRRLFDKVKTNIDVTYIDFDKNINWNDEIKENKEYAEKISYIQNAVGAVPSPFDCYLLTRSIKTLSVRMKQHNENAIAVSKYLSNHPKIEKVFFPGIDKRYMEIAEKQMDGFGGMMSFVIDSNIDGVKNFLKNLTLFTLAESLGGVESLIEHPAIMTHASIDTSIREKLGISDTLLRISVGIEDVDDLIADLDQALSKI